MTLIVIDGPVASGKSTLALALELVLAWAAL